MPLTFQEANVSVQVDEKLITHNPDPIPGLVPVQSRHSDLLTHPKDTACAKHTGAVVSKISE